MMTDMTKELVDEQMENDALRMVLRELKKELDELRRRRDGTIDDTRSIDSRDSIPHAIHNLHAGWVSMKPEKRSAGGRKLKWVQYYAVLNHVAFQLFPDEKPHSAAVISIDTRQVCHFRLVTAADVRVADAEQNRRIFHIMFDDRDRLTSRNASTNDLSTRCFCKDHFLIGSGTHSLQFFTSYLFASRTHLRRNVSLPCSHIGTTLCFEMFND